MQCYWVIQYICRRPKIQSNPLCVLPRSRYCESRYKEVQEKKKNMERTSERDNGGNKRIFFCIIQIDSFAFRQPPKSIFSPSTFILFSSSLFVYIRFSHFPSPLEVHIYQIHPACLAHCSHKLAIPYHHRWYEKSIKKIPKINIKSSSGFYSHVFHFEFPFYNRETKLK